MAGHSSKESSAQEDTDMDTDKERVALPRADSGTSSTSTDSSATTQSSSNSTTSTSTSSHDRRGSLHSISSASSLDALDTGTYASLRDSKGLSQDQQGQEDEEDSDADYRSCVEGEEEEALDEDETHGRTYSDETLLPTPTVELPAAAAAASSIWHPSSSPGSSLSGQQQQPALPHSSQPPQSTTTTTTTTQILAERLQQLKTLSSSPLSLQHRSSPAPAATTAAAASIATARGGGSGRQSAEQQQQQGFPWNASSSKMRMSSSSSTHSHQSHGNAATPSAIFSAPDFDEGLAQEHRQHARSRSWAAAQAADAAAAADKAAAAREQRERSLASSSSSSSTSRSSRPFTAQSDAMPRWDGTHRPAQGAAPAVAKTSSNFDDGDATSSTAITTSASRHPHPRQHQHPPNGQHVSAASAHDALLPSFLSSSRLQPAAGLTTTTTPEAMPADAQPPHPALRREDTVRASSPSKAPSQSSRLSPEHRLGGDHLSALEGSALASAPGSPVGSFQHLATFAASSSSSRTPVNHGAASSQSADATSSRGRHFSVDSGVSGQHDRQQRMQVSTSAQSLRSAGLLLAQPPGSSAAMASSRQHRPSTASSGCSNASSGSVSARPWVKDSDASSVRSGMSSDGSLHEEAGGPDTLAVMSPCVPPQVPFLPTGPQPAGCKITVDASAPDHFLVVRRCRALRSRTSLSHSSGTVRSTSSPIDTTTRQPLPSPRPRRPISRSRRPLA